MFSFFKKNKKEDSEPMTKDEEQIAKAKEDISEKGPDSQTEKDRIDESVGEQEREDGNKDSQTAKDRVDESEGAKKADEKKDEGEEPKGEETDKAEDDKEYVSKADFEKLAARVEEILTQMQNQGKNPERVDEEKEKRLNRIKGLYND